MRIYLTITRRNLPQKIAPLRTLLQKAARLTIEAAARWQLPQRLEISLLLTDDEGIRTLNCAYRGKDIPTDVLSFPLWEKQPPLLAGGIALPLGDIVISLTRATAQAQELEHSATREIAFLFIHGLLHLLGYDHEQDETAAQRMFALQKKILAQLGG